MTLIPGSRLGPYEISGAIGAGAMGEVFKARDTKLGRDVAIKVLPAEVADNPARLLRFGREARILAALNHPNIAQVYGFETVSPQRGPVVHFIAMELVEGEDLEARLKRGAIPVDESIAIAKQIATALEEAHEHGIVHRDLKPANIKLTRDGRVKVLDFGIGKELAEESDQGGEGSSSQTSTHAGRVTEEGTIVGTPMYMSPEQARGHPVDRRSDIWSFGVVFFEMLTGKRLFDGKNLPDVLVAVLTAEPDWATLPPSLPPEVARLLARCLDRDVKNRLQSIGEARISLAPGASGAHPGSNPRIEVQAPRKGRTWIGGGAAAVLIAFVIGGVVGRGAAGTRPSILAPPGEALFEISPPEKRQFMSGLAISGDGQNIAFVARGEDGRTRLFVRPMNDAKALELPGTVDARYPFWAPDGRRIGFFAENRLRITDLLGGLPQAIADVGSNEDVRGGAWGKDDRIVFAPAYTGPLVSVAVAGGSVTPVTELGDDGIATHRFPSFLPDGRRFVFYASAGTGIEPGILYLGRMGGPLKPKKLGSANSSALYVDPGFLLYVRGDSLVAHRFDLSREELTGEPVSLGVSLPGSMSVSGQRSLDVSRTGVLVYRMDKHSGTRLVWVDREGRELNSLTTDADTWHYGPTLSPDGRRVAVSHHEPGSTSGGIWIHDLERSLASRVTADDKSDDSVIVWSPDGSEVAFGTASGTGGNRINRVTVNEPGPAREILTAPAFASPSAWLKDGRLIYTMVDGTGRGSLFIRPLASNGTAVRMGSDKVSEGAVDVSPDGKWIAYAGDPTRRMEVYLRRLDDTTGNSTIRVSSEGGTGPRFRADGRELFFLADSGKLMSVPIQSLDPPRPGVPTPMFEARLEAGTDRQYDVSHDGKRFLLNRSLVQEQVPIDVLINWNERLQRGQAQK